jgi:hypothetical protein
VPEPRRKLPWRPVLIAFVSGIVLAGSSCAGALTAEMGNHQQLEKILTGGFLLGAAAALISVFVLVILAIVSMVMGNSKGTS